MDLNKTKDSHFVPVFYFKSFLNDSRNLYMKDLKKGTLYVKNVGISNELFAELTKHRNKSPKTDFVFENSARKFIDFYNIRNRHFLKDIAESGVRMIRFHDLRHTFASHYMMNGGNIFDLQKILGHSDIKTTMRYAHLAPDHIAHTAEIVNFTSTNKNSNSAKVIRFKPSK